MRRREFITALGGAAAWPVVVRAQQAERMRRVGVLQPGSESDSESQLRRAAFVDGLLKFGWTEATNVLIHYRWVGEDLDRIRLYATELTSMQPDVIWASGSLPLLLLKTGDAHHSGRLHAGLRSSWQRIRHEPHSAWRQHHGRKHIFSITVIRSQRWPSI